MKLFVYCLLFLFSLQTLKSQDPEICGYRMEMERILKRNPNFLTWQNAWYAEALRQAEELSNSKRTITADTLYFEIPVVFHVLYNKTAENISDAALISQLNELNRAFRKLTEDTARIRSVFRPLAGDVRIQFVLASKDPQGNPHSGINRIYTSKTTFGTSNGAYTLDMKYDARGGKTAWDPTAYMNIWICNMQFGSSGAIVLGFATPPTGSPNWGQFPGSTKDSTDLESGVVLHYRVVGRNQPNPYLKYTEGKTAVHEVGHYLGLRHIWGDGSFNAGCSVDDGIDDTPNARLASTSCNGQNTCTDASGDLPDQTENYMDYALDGCAGMFSRKQAYMMRYVLDKLRTGLPVRKIVYDTAQAPVDDNAELKFSVFPNPAHPADGFKVRIEGKSSMVYNMDIYDLNGKLVSSQLLQSGENKIESAALARSLYYIIIRDRDGRQKGREKLLIW